MVGVPWKKIKTVNECVDDSTADEQITRKKGEILAVDCGHKRIRF